jgi:cytoskeletal protein RodZ
MSAISGTEFPRDGNPDPSSCDAAAFGEFLRARRQRAGISLDRISSDTKISQRHFASLERGDVRSWPPGMYTRAFVRAYAESVGIDKDYAVEQFERVFKKRDEPVVPPPPTSAPPVAPWALLPTSIAIVLVALAALAISWALEPQRAEAKRSDATAVRRTTHAAIPNRQAPAPVPVPAAVSVPAPVTASPPAAKPQTDIRRVGTTGATIAIPSAHTAPAAPAMHTATVPSPQRAPTPPRPAPGDPELFVTSDPPGARVTVNGIGWGETPVTIRYLPLGTKRIRLTKPGYLSTEQIIALSSDKPSAQVEVTLQARP